MARARRARLVRRSVCVFCGSTSGDLPDYARAARALGQLLAQNEVSLVYGGGRIGLMGELADACLNAGGRVVGVIPRALLERELGHPGLTTLHVVGSMHERKALMADMADAFLALPGGMGTFDELFEIITWAQLGLHNKPVAVVNVAGYFDRLLAAIDHAKQANFITERHRTLLRTAPDVQNVLQTLWQDGFP
jgi:uncharacterized protein (TIGR00730 family)